MTIEMKLGAKRPAWIYESPLSVLTDAELTMITDITQRRLDIAVQWRDAEAWFIREATSAEAEALHEHHWNLANEDVKRSSDLHEMLCAEEARR